MTNHAHLLVTPQERGAVSRMMQAIGRRYVAGFNARYRRTGTLWEGRFKAALVDSDQYVLACYRYIELNPVRAGMVSVPAGYPWSSHRRNAYGASEPRITSHPCYLELGAGEARLSAYRRLFAKALGSGTMDAIRLHTQQQRAWGSEGFQRQVEALTRRIASVRPRGRPWPTGAG